MLEIFGLHLFQLEAVREELSVIMVHEQLLNELLSLRLELAFRREVLNHFTLLLLARRQFLLNTLLALLILRIY